MTSNNETVPAKISVQAILQTLLDSMTSERSSALLPANSEFTQRDGKKKRTANRLCVTNVTRL